MSTPEFSHKTVEPLNASNTASQETQTKHFISWVPFQRYLEWGTRPEDADTYLPRLSSQSKAQLLYEYCISTNKNVPESVHSLYIIGEHYASERPTELDSGEIINGLPAFFNSLKNDKKADYCYNQVTESLSALAEPVTVNSILATRRRNPNDPYSSFAGRFVRKVTRHVSFSLVAIGLCFVAYLLWNQSMPDAWKIPTDSIALQYATWVAFGCVGALVHLLNHALTTTRLQTFEVSEERKVWPRFQLGGLFGFILPWLIMTLADTPSNDVDAILPGEVPYGTVAAFFGGYSVRFATGLLERILNAFLPDTDTKK